MSEQKKKPERFLVPAETLSEIRKVIMALREVTLSQSEHKALGKLLGSLTHLEPEPVAAKPAWDCPQAFIEPLLKKYKKSFERQYLESWTDNLNSERVKFTITDAQTSTSSLVGKSVRHPLSGLLGVITQELLNGEVRVKWAFCDDEYNWSKENLGL